MKRMISCLVVSLLLLVSVQAHAHDASSVFNKMKSLEGEWHGTRADGKSTTLTYEVVSGGNAVMERITPEDEPNMITMYHLDGNQLVMTHYCATGNQPRMRGEAGNGDENVIRFSMIDITNLAEPAGGHMNNLVLTFKDDDHISHAWTWVEGEKKQIFPFELERKVMKKDTGY